MLHPIGERVVEGLILILTVPLLPCGRSGQIFLKAFTLGFLFYNSGIMLPTVQGHDRT